MSNNDEKSSIRKRIGEFMILAIYLFGDVLGFWNWDKYHVLCLFIAVFGIIALLLLDGGFSYRQIAMVAGLSVLGSIVISFALGPVPEPHPVEITGVLRPGAFPTPANA